MPWENQHGIYYKNKIMNFSSKSYSNGINEIEHKLFWIEARDTIWQVIGREREMDLLEFGWKDTGGYRTT